jgi:heptaprenyl diphosphate synthase
MTRKRIHLALLTALGAVLFAVEELIALPVPFFRIGFANVVTVLVLVWYGGAEAMAVTVLRVVVGSLLIGSLFQPSFIFSFLGGAASAAAMGLMRRSNGRFFSLVGISLVGALVKNAVQLSVAALWMVKHLRVFSLLPLFFLVSFCAGTLVGVSALILQARLPAGHVDPSGSIPPERAGGYTQRA